MRRSWIHHHLPAAVLRQPSKYPRFDLCIIGAGPAGVAAAVRAVNFGKRVCLIESGRVGGADLWGGTVPSKTLWDMATSLSRISSPDICGRLIDPAPVQKLLHSVDPQRILRTLREVSETREKEYLEVIQSSGVELLHGKAIFAGANEVDVHREGTGEYHVVEADHFIIATGSRPREHPLHPTDHRRIITSDDIFELPLPSSMVILGGGPMGCEFASTYAKLGRTKIALIDKAARILSAEDEDVAQSVEENLCRRGVTIHHDCRLIDLQATSTGCEYAIQSRAGEDAPVETHEVECALVAIGREPNYNGLGLENTAMRVRDHHIELDAFNRCIPYNHIYCIGDASMYRGQVHLAQASARAAVQHMFSSTNKPTFHSTELKNVSYAVFLETEVACLGMNESQCQAAGLAYYVAKYDYAFLSRALIMGDTTGFVKLIVSRDRQKRVLGVRAVGTHAGSVVEVVSLAIRHEDSVYSLLHLNAAYPSMVEGLIECARMLVGRGSMQANVTAGMTIHEWSPDTGVAVPTTPKH